NGTSLLCRASVCTATRHVSSAVFSSVPRSRKMETRRSATLADLVHRGEHASDTARRGGVGRRTVGNGKVRLLGEARTLDVKLKIFNPGGRSAAERRVDQGLEDVPDFGPALADGQTQRVRVIEAENWNVGIVINANVVGPPPQQHGKPVGQHQTDGGAQGSRPALGGPRRLVGPTEAPDALAHPAAADEPFARFFKRSGFPTQFFPP